MLLDHAWSFATLADAKQSLTVVEGLLQRVHELLFPALPSDEVHSSASATAEALGRVMGALQTKIGSYSTAAQSKSQAQNTTFFLLDEVGARMGQARAQLNASPDRQPEPAADDAASDEQPQQPNYKCLPFYSLDDRVAYRCVCGRARARVCLLSVCLGVSVSVCLCVLTVRVSVWL